MIAALLCRFSTFWGLGLCLGLLLFACGARAQAQSPVFAPVPATPVHSPQAIPWLPHFARAAQDTGLDATLLEALAGVESNFNSRVVSRFGAIGLMQIMPVTAATMGLAGNRQAMRRQLLDPQTNVLTAARHLRQLLGQFAGDLELALAAYNAGVGNVLKAGGRVPPNRETPLFVQRVMARYAQLRPANAVVATPDSTSPSELPEAGTLGGASLPLGATLTPQPATE